MKIRKGWQLGEKWDGDVGRPERQKAQKAQVAWLGSNNTKTQETTVKTKNTILHESAQLFKSNTARKQKHLPVKTSVVLGPCST